MRDATKAKEIKRARRRLAKAENRYFRTGDVSDMFSVLEMQNSLGETYGNDMTKLEAEM